MSTDRPLRILHLEDDTDYTALVTSWLRRDGIVAAVEPVATREDFEAAVGRGGHDLVLLDYQLPGYSGVEALRFARERSPDLPLILVSGRIGEDVAVESLRLGATDFVLKTAPHRLLPAIHRALEEQEQRRGRFAAEAELLRQQKYFQTLTEYSSDVLAVLDRDTRVLYLSPSVSRVLGYRSEELLQKPASDLVHPGDRDVVRAVVRASLENGGEPVRFEVRCRHLDGSWRELEVISQDRLSDPELGAVVINARDISDRRHVEEDLRDSEKRFRELFESSPDAIFVEDLDGTVLDGNPAACELHGLSRTELVGRNVADLVPEELREDVRRRFADLAQGTLTEVEGTSLRRDGTTVPVAVRVRRIEYRGQPAILLHVRDVSQHKRLEEQLRHSQKLEALGQLAGGVAHDFNNILTVISGHAALLRAAAGLGPEIRHSAEQVIQAADRAAGLTRQLLAFGRRQLMQPRPVDLNQVVRATSQMLSRLLGEHIALRLETSDGASRTGQPALVQADPGMLEQVLVNLAVNARDAMPRGGVLTVRVSLTRGEASAGADTVCLEVADTGCGIPPENLGRIFDPFFTTKEIGKGTGLGLATAYGIVQQHGGRLEVESEPGRGATFRVYLPRLTQGVPVAEERPIEPDVRGGEETILVVEDEAEVRELVCHLLAAQGYRILQAESGARAIELWKNCKDQVDLLLTDLVMPEQVNGRQLAERLRSDRPELKVLITSGYSADLGEQDGALQPRPRFLQKPYHPRGLAAAVRECLDGAGCAS